jgi:hypothetical protein
MSCRILGSRVSWVEVGPTKTYAAFPTSSHLARSGWCPLRRHLCVHRAAARVPRQRPNAGAARVAPLAASAREPAAAPLVPELRRNATLGALRAAAIYTPLSCRLYCGADKRATNQSIYLVSR